MDEPDEQVSQRQAVAELYFMLLKHATDLQMSLNTKKLPLSKRIYLEKFRPELIAIYYVTRGNPKISDDEKLMKDMSCWLNADFSRGISQKHYESSIIMFGRFSDKLSDIGVITKV